MPSSRVWPDGTFGVCNFDRQFTLDIPEIKPVAEGQKTFIAAQIEAHGIEAVLAACADTTRWRANLDALEGAEQSEALGLLTAPNSPKSKRGAKGITTYGRLLVRNAAYFIEKTSPRDTVSFLTTTLPTVPIETNRYLCSVWEKIVKNFVKALKRDLQAAGLSGETVSATEIQEERYSKHGGYVGLHLHFVFQGRKPGKAWAVSTARVDELWENAVCSQCESIRGVVSFASSCQIVRVKGSMAGYISKYVSKGSKIVSKLNSFQSPVELPASWYSCTLTLRSRVKALQLGGASTAAKINEWIDRGRTDMFDRLNTITVELSDGSTLHVGWAGKLSEKGRERLGLPFTKGYKGKVELSL